jgi:hypothetical protein
MPGSVFLIKQHVLIFLSYTTLRCAASSSIPQCENTSYTAVHDIFFSLYECGWKTMPLIGTTKMCKMRYSVLLVVMLLMLVVAYRRLGKSYRLFRNVGKQIPTTHKSESLHLNRDGSLKSCTSVMCIAANGFPVKVHAVLLSRRLPVFSYFLRNGSLIYYHERVMLMASWR